MRSLLILIISFNSALVFGQVAEFSFDKTTVKFPKTNEGDTLRHYFVFTNTGKAPLKISKYEVECHCTSLNFPQYAIAPGAKDSVQMVFDTRGKYYHQDRTIVISSNARKKERVLRFKVYVEPKEE